MEVNRWEVYRYMGLRGTADAVTETLVEEVISELIDCATPRVISREFPLRQEGETLSFAGITVQSHSLSKNLDGCERILMFAATLGEGPDFLCRRYARTAVSRELAVQAAGAAMIEAYCDEQNENWRRSYEAAGWFLRPRFSPGYGDFPLSVQPLFLDVLRAGRTIGIRLTDSMLMTPTKSVTAVIGLSRRKNNCVRTGCGSCENVACPYRSEC